jgi:hypothetical protein
MAASLGWRRPYAVPSPAEARLCVCCAFRPSPSDCRAADSGRTLHNTPCHPGSSICRCQAATGRRRPRPAKSAATQIVAELALPSGWIVRVLRGFHQKLNSSDQANHLRRSGEMAARASSSAPLSSEVPVTRSRSGPSLSPRSIASIERPRSHGSGGLRRKDEGGRRQGDLSVTAAPSGAASSLRSIQ